MDGGGGGHNAAKFKTQLCGFAAVSDTTGNRIFFGWLLGVYRWLRFALGEKLFMDMLSSFRKFHGKLRTQT